MPELGQGDLGPDYAESEPDRGRPLVGSASVAASSGHPVKKRFPPAPQFTPGQVDLSRLLDLALSSVDCRSLQESVRSAFFLYHGKAKAGAAQVEAQHDLARNVLTAMRNYGLWSIEPECRLTSFGQRLASMSDPAVQLRAFARHILVDLPGLDLLQAARSIQQRGEAVSKKSLAIELERMGFFQARATTHATAMGQWLREAGVIGGGERWAIDLALVKDLSGVSLGDVDDWAGLTRDQRSFVSTLREIAEGSGTAPIPATRLADEVERRYGPLPSNDQLRAHVYGPLASQGWITNTGSSRGKSGVITPTQRLLDTNLHALTRLTSGQLPAELRPLLNTALPEIRRNLSSPDPHTKGIALELLAIRMASDAGLLPVFFRLRADSTGGAEVDLVAEEAHLLFARWLFQCKNTATVHLSAVAKEVGMAGLLRADVVVMVTTGRFAASVRGFTDKMNADGQTQVVLVDRDLLARYAQVGGSAIANAFHDAALSVMAARRAHLARSVEGLSE